MNLTILTLASEQYWPIHCLTANHKMIYSLKYGYNIDFRKQEESRFWWGYRQIACQQALANCDWVWHLGADCLITNHDIDVAGLCDPDYDLVICQDLNGWNNDSFLLQNTDASRKWLELLLQNKKKYPTDQHAMQSLGDRIRVKYVPQALLNAYPNAAYGRETKPELGNWEPGMLLLHVPGLPLDVRISILRQVLGLPKA